MARQHSQTAKPHPGSPLAVSVARLGRRPGSMFPLHEVVPNPSRIGLEMIGIQAGAPLELDLRVESVSEGVLVTGTLAAPTSGECARCLTPFTGLVEVQLTELFAYPDSITEATTEADEVGLGRERIAPRRCGVVPSTEVDVRGHMNQMARCRRERFQTPGAGKRSLGVSRGLHSMNVIVIRTNMIWIASQHRFQDGNDLVCIFGRMAVKAPKLPRA